MSTRIPAQVVIGMLLSLACQDARAQPRQGAGLTVFTDVNFRGRSASIRNDTSNFQTMGLNDQISSLRVAHGEQWQICEHANFGGRCAVVTGEESDLRRSGWNDKISSARRVGAGNRGGAGRGGVVGASLTLFDDRRFRGQSRRVDGETPWLLGFQDRAESVRVEGVGSWELCDAADFKGKCVVVSGSVPDLSMLGLRNRVASARPARTPR